MKNKKMLKGIALAAVIVSLAVGGTMAYLTDYDSTVNEFTVGKVDIELEEPNWDPDIPTKIEPTESIKKDPQIKNAGTNDAFVYLEVSIPIARVVVAKEDGTRKAAADTELFTFTANGGWTQLNAQIVGTNMVYTYAYNSILKPAQTTTTLFDEVTFVNVVEGYLDTQQLDIPVRAYAIQTTNTGTETGTVIQQATEAYEKYVNQNNAQDGQVTK
ncbi:MAG: SipW-dependent-type signal peptide-containing protein [Clostridiales bacterium]|nr:SipW-dependent-type signal peptide-containing protein [Clostridiales bacterium]